MTDGHVSDDGNGNDTDDETPTVALVCGSRRPGSVTRTTLTHIGAGVRDAGGEIDLIELADADLPMYSPAAHDAGDAEKLRQRLRAADAVVLGTPVYHGSFSGVLKNTIDYCGFEEFEGKPVAFAAVAGGPFPLPALGALRQVTHTMNAWSVPRSVAVPHSEDAVADGELAAEPLRTRAEGVGRLVTDAAGNLPSATGMRSRGA